MKIATIAQLIDALGGTNAVARALSTRAHPVRKGAVTAWKRRGFIPDQYRERLIRLAVLLAAERPIPTISHELISNLCSKRTARLQTMQAAE